MPIQIHSIIIQIYVSSFCKVKLPNFCPKLEHFQNQPISKNVIFYKTGYE